MQGIQLNASCYKVAILSQFYRKIVINQTVEIRLCYTRQGSVSRFRP